MHADFTCSPSVLCISTLCIPKYIDYYTKVTNSNNGHEPPILPARREFYQSTGTYRHLQCFREYPLLAVRLKLTPHPQIPDAYYFKGAAYQVVLGVTYPVNGTTGAPSYQVGGTETGINITGIAS